MSESKGNAFTVLIRKSVGLPTGGSSCCGATVSVAPGAAPDNAGANGGSSCCGATVTVEPSGSCCAAGAPSGAGESKPAAGSCCG